MPKVYIVGPDRATEIMFYKQSWEVVDDPEKADMLQFTGGSDVSPSFYGEVKLPMTSCDLSRDARELNIFYEFETKPKAGICRGGQLLNVANKGKLWQHVNNHGLVDVHPAYDLETCEVLPVTSSHHQMMIPVKGARILLLAHEASYKRSADKEVTGRSARPFDTEAVYYEKTESFCYQPHPEWCDPTHPCQVWYFNKIKQLFDLGD